MRLTLRGANPADQGFLLKLYSSTRLEEIATWGLDERQAAAFLQTQFAAQQRWYAMAYPAADFCIVLADDEPAGRLIVQRGVEILLLVDISLLPEHRGKGTGTMLLQELMCECKTAGTPMQLHVLIESRAVAWYERLGFRRTGEDQVYLEMQWKPD